MNKLILLAIIFFSAGIIFLAFYFYSWDAQKSDQPGHESTTIIPTGPIVVGPSGLKDPEQGVRGEATTDIVDGEGIVEVDLRDPILKMISGSHSSVRTMPASAPADGITAITVILTARTSDGKLIVGAPANIETNRGVQDEVEAIRGRTGSDGQAIFLVRSKEPGAMVITGRLGTKTIDEKGTIKFTPPPSLTLSLPPHLLIGSLSIIAFILVVQYMFVRSVLDTRRFEEEELFFHHPARKTE